MPRDCGIFSGSGKKDKAVQFGKGLFRKRSGGKSRRESVSEGEGHSKRTARAHREKEAPNGTERNRSARNPTRSFFLPKRISGGRPPSEDGANQARSPAWEAFRALTSVPRRFSARRPPERTLPYAQSSRNAGRAGRERKEERAKIVFSSATQVPRQYLSDNFVAASDNAIICEVRPAPQLNSRFVKKILHTEKDVPVSEITEHGCRTQKGTPFNPP